MSTNETKRRNASWLCLLRTCSILLRCYALYVKSLFIKTNYILVAFFSRDFSDGIQPVQAFARKLRLNLPYVLISLLYTLTIDESVAAPLSFKTIPIPFTFDLLEWDTGFPPTGRYVLGGVPFDYSTRACIGGGHIWWQDFDRISFPVNVPNVYSLDMLINTDSGHCGITVGVIALYGSSGAYYSKYLVEGTDIRGYQEHHSMEWACTTINGTTTTNVYSSNGIRLDKMRVTLPPEFRTQILTKMEFGVLPAPPYGIGKAFMAGLTVLHGEIIDVIWSSGNGEIDNHLSGKRIFPDKLSQGDTVSRSQVKVKAITSLRKGAPVYFKAFDVDDPSSDISPVDSNGPEGDDNRDPTRKTGRFSNGAVIVEAKTDQDGIAEVTFDVGVQPGDNYQVVASLNKEYLEKIAYRQLKFVDEFGESLPNEMAKFTDTLTVWRRLYIKVARMKPVHDNYLEGSITNVAQRMQENGAHVSVVTLDKSTEAGRFQGGRLVVGADSNVKEYTLNWSLGDTVTVVVTGGNSPVMGETYRLYDDDDLYNNDTKKDGDSGEPFPMPDTTYVSVALAPAFVEPRFISGDDVTFRPNIWFGPGYPDFSSETSQHRLYWSTYLMSAYQPGLTRDGDPDTEAHVAGIAVFIDQLPEYAMIYAETIRDWCKKNGLSDFTSRTVVHELGHILGLDHPNPRDGSIMDDNAIDGVFSTSDLNSIRSIEILGIRLSE